MDHGAFTGDATKRSVKSRRKQVCEEFIANLERRSGLDFVVDEELLASVRHHFKNMPTLYAMEINVEGLDVLVCIYYYIFYLILASMTHPPHPRRHLSRP